MVTRFGFEVSQGKHPYHSSSHGSLFVQSLLVGLAQLIQPILLLLFHPATFVDEVNAASAALSPVSVSPTKRFSATVKPDIPSRFDGPVIPTTIVFAPKVALAAAVTVKVVEMTSPTATVTEEGSKVIPTSSQVRVRIAGSPRTAPFSVMETVAAAPPWPM